jgi:hypothetical protein
VAAAALLLFSLTVPVPLWAAAPVTGGEETAGPLPESGILYPEGFDPNTFGQVEGTVADHAVPPRGPVTFTLRGARETFRVILSPSWFWNTLATGITDGQKVRVKGSKAVGHDNRLYLIAQELQLPDGRSIALREPDGRPLWRGGRGQGHRGGRMGNRQE